MTEHKHILYHQRTMNNPYTQGITYVKVYACKNCNKKFVEIEPIHDKIVEEK